MSNTSNAAGGLSFGSLLTLIFVAAKLWGKIDWSWIWVFSPLWIGFGIILAVLAATLVVAGILYVIGSVMDIPSNLRARSRRKERAKAREKV